MPIEITAAKTKNKRPAAGLLSRELSFGKPKVTVKDRMFFTEQLSLLLETGVPLHPALEALSKQAGNLALVEVVNRLLEDVGGGRPLSEALRAHPQMFSTTYATLVAAGETGGFLHEVLKQLQHMDESAQKLRATLSAALTYPIFLVFFSVAVVIFILAVVFPKFAVFFRSIRDQLPITTVFLMGLSDVVRQHWMALLAGLAGLSFGITRWARRPEALHWVDGLKLRIPVVKDVFIQLYLVKFMRVLGLSLANGVNLLDALHSCRDVVRNRVFREFIDQVETQVTGGQGVAAAFQEISFIPPTVRQMVATGEQTGNLALVMTRVADFYERELERRVTALSKMAEPVMLVVMGAVVGVIVSSLILPIFKLSRAAH